MYEDWSDYQLTYLFTLLLYSFLKLNDKCFYLHLKSIKVRFIIPYVHTWTFKYDNRTHGGVIFFSPFTDRREKWNQLLELYQFYSFLSSFLFVRQLVYLSCYTFSLCTNQNIITIIYYETD